MLKYVIYKYNRKMIVLIQIIHFLINIGNGLECNDQMKNIEYQSSMQRNVFEEPQNKYSSQFSKHLFWINDLWNKTIIKINRKYKIHVSVN